MFPLVFAGAPLAKRGPLDQTPCVAAELYTNWVAGRPVPSAAGESFERRAHVPPFEPTGRWPRSHAEDLIAAMEATEAAARAWRARPRSERVGLVRALSAELSAQPDGTPALARALGLESSELRPRLDEDLFRAAESIEIAADMRTEEPPGCGLFVAHWSDLVGGLASRVAARLLGGAGVCVLADPHLPEAAERLARALAASVGPGPWSIVHTDLQAPLVAGLDWERLAWLRWRAPREMLESVLAGRPVPPPTWQLWTAANSSHLVPEGADVASEAAAVVQKALGRCVTLSGQLPGQVGRIYCHQRLFSRFQEELLDLLEGSADAARPVPLVEDDLFEHVHRAWTVGLDEGATPIFGGAPARTPHTPQSATGGDAPARRAPPALGPIVFTNVDTAGELVRLERPAPILGLCRVASDAEARALAAEFEGARAAFRPRPNRGPR